MKNNTFKSSLKILILVLTALSFNERLTAQTAKTENNTFVKSNSISFSDKAFATKVTNSFANFVTQNGDMSPKINNYTKLINDYHYIEFRFGYKKLYKSNKLVFDLNNQPQFLNDELLILDNGKIFNLVKDDYEKITIYPGSKPQILSIESFDKFSIDNPPLKSDIITSYGYVNNILKGKGFLAQNNDFDLKIYNNSFSNYVLVELLNTVDRKKVFINKYNSRETQNYQEIDYIENNVFTYTDSTYYIPVKLSQWEDYKLLTYEFNTPIRVNYEDIYFSDNGYGDSKALENLNKYKYDLGETYYYFKKYNNTNLQENYTRGATSQFKNETTTYKNLFDVGPVFILEYNFISKKLKSVLDRSIYPFTKIEKLLLDKYNRFLFIQDGANITIFDLLAKKEVVTFPGKIDSIDENNFLKINLYAKYSEGVGKHGLPEEIISNMYYDTIDINELYNNSKLTHFAGLEKFNIDEFMTKEELNKKIDVEYYKQLSVFSENSFLEIKTMPTNTIITPTSDLIISKITNTIKQHVETVNKNLRLDSLQLDLIYENYSFDEKSITLNFNSKDLNLITPFVGRKEDFIKNISFDFEGRVLKLNVSYLECRYQYDTISSCSIEITGVDPELARNLKLGSLSPSIVLSSSNNFNSTIPNYNSTFILQNANLNSYFQKASMSFLERKNNVINLKIGNSIKPISIINLIELNNQKLVEDNKYTINIVENVKAIEKENQTDDLSLIGKKSFLDTLEIVMSSDKNSTSFSKDLYIYKTDLIKSIKKAFTGWDQFNIEKIEIVSDGQDNYYKFYLSNSSSFSASFIEAFVLPEILFYEKSENVVNDTAVLYYKDARK